MMFVLWSHVILLGMNSEEAERTGPERRVAKWRSFPEIFFKHCVMGHIVLAMDVDVKSNHQYISLRKLGHFASLR